MFALAELFDRTEKTCMLSKSFAINQIRTDLSTISSKGYSHSKYNTHDFHGVIKNLASFEVQCPPLNRITLGQHISDNNNRMIQLIDVFCVLFRYNGTSNI